MYLYNTFVSFLIALSLTVGLTHAAQQPADIANSCNELASQTFTLKNLVIQINSTSNAGPMVVGNLLSYSPVSFLWDTSM